MPFIVAVFPSSHYRRDR